MQWCQSGTNERKRKVTVDKARARAGHGAPPTDAHQDARDNHSSGRPDALGLALGSDSARQT